MPTPHEMSLAMREATQSDHPFSAGAKKSPVVGASLGAKPHAFCTTPNVAGEACGDMLGSVLLGADAGPAGGSGSAMPFFTGLLLGGLVGGFLTMMYEKDHRARHSQRAFKLGVEAGGEKPMTVARAKAIMPELTQHYDMSGEEEAPMAMRRPPLLTPGE